MQLLNNTNQTKPANCLSSSDNKNSTTVDKVFPSTEFQSMHLFLLN